MCRIVAQKSVSFFRNAFSNIQDHNSRFGLKEENINSDYVTLSNLTRHDSITAAQVTVIPILMDNATQSILQELEVCLLSVIFKRMLEAVGYFTEAVSDDKTFIAEAGVNMLPKLRHFKQKIA